MKSAETLYSDIYDSIDFLEDFDIEMMRVTRYGKAVSEGKTAKANAIWWLLHDSMDFLDDIDALMKRIEQYGRAMKREDTRSKKGKASCA